MIPFKSNGEQWLNLGYIFYQRIGIALTHDFNSNQNTERSKVKIIWSRFQNFYVTGFILKAR